MSETDDTWAALPTETEIYILPNGEVVIADLPVELAATLAGLSALFHEHELPDDSLVNGAGASPDSDPALDHTHVAN